MFPTNTIQAKIDIFQQNQKEISRVIKFTNDFDFKNALTPLIDGSPAQIDNIEAIKKWIVLFLITPKGQYSIYEGTGFGTSFYKIKGNKFLTNSGYTEAEILRELKEGVKLCPAIKDVTAFSLGKQDDILTANITIQLYNGELVNIDLDEEIEIKRN